MKIVAVIQARMGSTRLPNKVMAAIQGTPMIGLLLERLAKSRHLTDIVVATSDHPRNDPLAAYVQSRGCSVFRGSENDVLDRYYRAASAASADVVVRVTGDCPLIDPSIVDRVIERYLQGNLDYVSNTLTPTYPDGLDTEVCSFEALRTAWQTATTQFDREHVTPFIKREPGFRRANVAHDRDLSAQRWTVDEPDDFVVVRHIFDHFHPRRDFDWLEVARLCEEHPDWFMANQHIARNEGATMGTGQKLWKRAKRVIPGGNMFLSKRAEMWLPEKWPAYFSRASGVRVWDLDGREYLDMSIMAIGTNSLGYGDPEVDEAVRRTIANGNMSTLNAPEEVYLAEKLVALHPWSAMVRLARTGGEANAIAVRIARAASGKDSVAICGYHGWHDWYLAANLGSDQSLAGHLLPGLAPVGVPRNLRGSVLPFRYNHFEELEALVRDHPVGLIVMEVSRNLEPKGDFLKQVREFATKKGITLMFDECTSGFRQAFGGLHKFYGVEPDMATFGKALGNGYAITAVIGKREIMEVAQDSFISSTFWSERIGPSAAVKTLEVMERVKSWDIITETGRAIGKRWQELATRHGLPIEITGLPSMLGFSFPVKDMLKYKTLITQEMLKKGFLATVGIYTCTRHTPAEIDPYIDALDQVFGLIKECESGRDVDALLEGPVCHAGFRRLN